MPYGSCVQLAARKSCRCLSCALHLSPTSARVHPRRNAIVLSPHVRAAKCSIEAARIVREAAEAAGAPKGLIQWIEKPSLALATALMKDPKINLILATGVACWLLHAPV
jgi:acyl-CoA reductase-like NAD-dependent aldehyde dehydrogenase